MKNLTKFVSAAILLSGVFIFGVANADVVVSQPTLSTQSSLLSSSVQMYLGTGLTGVLESASIAVRGDTASSTTMVFTLFECNTKVSALSYTSCSTKVTTSFSTVTTQSIRTLDLSSGGSLNALKYYFVTIDHACPGDCINFRIYGNAATSTSQMEGAKGFSNQLQPVVQPFFALSTTFLGASRIVSLNYPTYGAVTNTTGVSFSYTYNNLGSYDRTGVTVFDLTTQQFVPTSSQTPSSGTNNAVVFASLQPSHLYEWNAYLSSSESLLIPTITSGKSRFSTITDENSILIQNTGTTSVNLNLPSPYLITEANASSTVDQYTQSMRSFIVMFSNQFPINWFYEIATLLKDTTATSSTPTWTADFTAYNASNTYSMIPDHVTILSDGVMTGWIKQDDWDDLRNISALMMWAAFAFFFYKRVSSITL